MSRAHVDAMVMLGDDNPIDDNMGWWTRTDEDDLLARTLDAASLPDTPGVDAPFEPPGKANQIGRVVLIAACLVVLGCVALGLDLAGGRSQSAFAAWTPTISTAHPGQLGRAEAACQKFYKHASTAFPSIPRTLPPLALLDTRGPFELAVYAGPSGEGVCLWHPSGVVGAGSGNGESLPAESKGSIGVPGVGFMTAGRHSVVTYAYGKAGPQVRRVTLRLTNGDRVQATVRNGYYGAWWPSKTDVVAASVTSANAVHREDFCDIGPNNMGPFTPVRTCGRR